MRALYEGYAEALGNYLRMPLPPWIADTSHKDNWLAVAKLRAETEAANPASGSVKQTEVAPHPMTWLADDEHEF